MNNSLSLKKQKHQRKKVQPPPTVMVVKTIIIIFCLFTITYSAYYSASLLSAIHRQRNE